MTHREFLTRAATGMGGLGIASVGLTAREARADAIVTQELVFETIAQARLAEVGANRPSIHLNGYYAAGDGGGGQYRVAANEPSHAAKFQSRDGTWFELVESVVRPEHLGARGFGGDDTEAITNWLQFIAGGRALGILPAKIYVVGPIRAQGLKNVTIYGLGRTASILAPRDPHQEFILEIDDGCSSWELRHFSFDGRQQSKSLVQALLICDGTQINAHSMTFQSAEIGAWFRRGGYCVCDDWFVGSCSKAFIRTGGSSSVRKQFSESVFTNFILDAQWSQYHPDVNESNRAELIGETSGVGLDIDFGSAFLKFDHITGAGIAIGIRLHNTLTKDAWPSRESAPDGIYFYDINFDWVGQEAFRVDNALLFVVDRAYCRSLSSFAARLANFGNAQLRSFFCYASHQGGMEIAGSFSEVNLTDIGLAGNAWPQNTGGTDLHLTGTDRDLQGLVRIQGGTIACSDGKVYFPLLNVSNKSDYGITVDGDFTTELILENVYFRGHNKAETLGVLGRANTHTNNCYGLKPNASTQ